MIKNLLLFLIASFFLISCTREEHPEELLTLPNAVDVYVFGTQNENICYWKNGKITLLPQGEYITADFFGIDGNLIYACGTKNPNLTSGNTIYYFWINGNQTNLNNYLNVENQENFKLTSFLIKDENIYCSGISKNLSAPEDERFEYYYWKNKTRKLVFKSPFYNPKFKVTPIGKDIYLSGDDGINFGYYKNDEFFPLQNSRVSYFFEHLGEVYFAGFNANNNYFYKKLSSNSEIILPTDNFRIFSKNDNLHLENGKQYFLNDLKNLKIDITNTNISEIRWLDALGKNTYTIYTYDSGNAQYKVFINDVEFMKANNSQNFVGIIAVQN